MEIALIIVGGIVLISIVSIVGDFLTKTKLSRPSADSDLVKSLEQRLVALEAKSQDQEAKIALLENDVAFTTKLLEKK